MKYLHIVNFCVLLSLCLSKAFIEAAPTPTESKTAIDTLEDLDFRKMKNISMLFDALERKQNTDCNLLLARVDKFGDTLLTRPTSTGQNEKQLLAWDNLEPILSGPDGIKPILEPVKDQLMIVCDLIKRPEDWKEFKTVVSQHVSSIRHDPDKAFDKLEEQFKNNPSLEQAYLRFKVATLKAIRRDKILTEKIMMKMSTS